MLRQQPLSPAKVAFAWRAAVGSSLGRATTASLDPAGQLVVLARNAHWQREVRRSVDLIAARLDRLLGAGVVGRIVVKLHEPDPRTGTPVSRSPRHVRLRR